MKKLAATIRKQLPEKYFPVQKAKYYVFSKDYEKSLYLASVAKNPNYTIITDIIRHYFWHGQLIQIINFLKDVNDIKLFKFIERFVVDIYNKSPIISLPDDEKLSIIDCLMSDKFFKLTFSKDLDLKILNDLIIYFFEKNDFLQLINLIKKFSESNNYAIFEKLVLDNYNYKIWDNVNIENKIQIFNEIIITYESIFFNTITFYENIIEDILYNFIENFTIGILLNYITNNYDNVQHAFVDRKLLILINKKSLIDFSAKKHISLITYLINIKSTNNNDKQIIDEILKNSLNTLMENNQLLLTINLMQSINDPDKYSKIKSFLSDNYSQDILNHLTKEDLLNCLKVLSSSCDFSLVFTDEITIENKIINDILINLIKTENFVLLINFIISIDKFDQFHFVLENVKEIINSSEYLGLNEQTILYLLKYLLDKNNSSDGYLDQFKKSIISYLIKYFITNKKLPQLFDLMQYIENIDKFEFIENIIASSYDISQIIDLQDEEKFSLINNIISIKNKIPQFLSKELERSISTDLIKYYLDNNKFNIIVNLMKDIHNPTVFNFFEKVVFQLYNVSLVEKLSENEKKEAAGDVLTIINNFPTFISPYIFIIHLSKFFALPNQLVNYCEYFIKNISDKTKIFYFVKELSSTNHEYEARAILEIIKTTKKELFYETNFFNLYFELNLSGDQLENECALNFLELLEDIVTINNFSLETCIFVLRWLNEIIRRLNHNNIDITIFQNFYNLLLFKMSKYDNYYSKNEKEIAFFVPNLHATFKYFLPIVKNMGHDKIDIVVEKHLLPSSIVEYGIENFKIVEDLTSIKNYRYVLADFWNIRNYEHMFNENSILIPIWHGTDCAWGEEYLQKLSLVLVQFETAILNQNNLFYKNMLSNEAIEHISSMNRKSKCEIVITGPFHMEELFKLKNKYTKEQLREMLAEQTGIVIPSDKPVIFFSEDEFSTRDDIYQGLNNLCYDFTIIFKEVEFDPERSAKLNDKILIYTKHQFAANLVKLSSDYIFCGIGSGTFMTSIMADIICVPYYTEVQKQKFLNDPEFSYKKFIPEKLKYNFYYWDYLNYHYKLRFNILDSEHIKKSILSGECAEYFNTFNKTYSYKLFGNYYRESAAKKAAEYILEFVKNGTLGKKADAFYLKHFGPSYAGKLGACGFSPMLW